MLHLDLQPLSQISAQAQEDAVGIFKYIGTHADQKDAEQVASSFIRPYATLESIYWITLMEGACLSSQLCGQVRALHFCSSHSMFLMFEHCFEN